MKNLLLIDSAVSDYQTFVNSVNTDTAPFVYTPATTREELLTFIGVNTIERMALVSHETQTFLGEPFYSDTNTTFFIDTIRQYQIKHLDFLACDTLNNPAWKAFYDNLHTETGVIVGASDNLTGNLKYGGDWILESTSEDIELIYFTSRIEYYNYLLGSTGGFTMIVKTDGKIWGAGYNGYVNLANGDYTYTNQSSFINVTALQSSEFQLKTVKLLKCGTRFTFALMTDGTLWGAGDSNLVGVTTVAKKFAEVASVGTIVSLDCGDTHTVLYTTDNKLWGVGNNNFGRLGLGASPQFSTFQEITGIEGTIKAVACGGIHTVVLTTANKLWVTGYNSDKELGLGVGDTTTRYEFTKIDIDTLSGKIPDIIACGYDTIFVSMTDGTIWTPRSGVFSQVSNTNNYYNGLRKPVKFACFIYHSFVLMSDGTLWGMGDGDMLGPNVTEFVNFEYRQMTPPTTIKSIWGGEYYSIVLGTNNTLYVTGFNTYGQFGNGSVPTSGLIDDFVISTTDVSLLQGDVLQVVSLSITSIGQAANGLITINGTNFITPTVTMTGGFTSGTVTKVSSIQLTFIPSSFIGSATFTVTDSGSSVSYVASFPTITSICQSANGLVTINGTNFATPTVTMTGGFTSGTVTKVSSTQLTFTPTSFIGNDTPLTSSLIESAIFTVTDSGSSVSYVASFPTITSIRQAENGLVTINGTNFITPTVTMTGGFTSGTVTKVNSTQLTFTPSSFIESATFTVADSGSSVAYTAYVANRVRCLQVCGNQITASQVLRANWSELSTVRK